MYNLKSKEKKEAIEIQLEGNLTINEAVEVKECFQKVVSNNMDIIVDISEGKEFDLTFLQLLIALKKSVQDEDRQIVFKPELPAAFWEAMNNAGLSDDLWLQTNNQSINSGGNNE